MLPTPTPLLEDELLFSCLGNLAAANALLDTRSALARFTSSRNYCVSADLPCHLTSIFESVGPSISAESVNALIERHTLFPYYRFFSPWARWLRVREIALSHEGGRLKAAMGILAHGVRATPVLRYCPICAQQSRADNGRAFWHRAHNLPGVIACSQHGCRLVATLSQAQFGHRARLWPAPKPDLRRYVEATRAQTDFAMLSRDVLFYARPHISADAMRDAYVREMHDRGWTHKGRPDLGQLSESVRATLRNALDGDVARRFCVDRSAPMPWLRDLISPRDRSCSPVAHVLLIHVLFGTFAHFLGACEEQRGTHAKYGDGLSVVRSPAPGSATPGKFDRAMMAVRDSSRSCRDVAQEFGVSVGWVVKQRRIAGMAISERRKSLDSAKVIQITRLLSTGTPVADIAQTCSVSLSTAYRVLSSDLALLERRDNLLRSRTQEARRAEWLGLAAEHPGLGTKALRFRGPRCYAWLYRNDRAWLSAHQPVVAAQRRPQRVDWSQRDADLARRVSSAPFPEAGGRVPRTVFGYASLVYPTSSMGKHSEKLPRFAAAAKARVEQKVE